MTDRPTNGSNGAPEETRHGRGPSRGDLIAKLEELQRDLEGARADADEKLRSSFELGPDEGLVARFI